MSAEQISAVDPRDRAESLGRPVRVLMSGISDQIVQDTKEADIEQKIDFNYPSQNLSDFDLLLILVDEYEDAFNIHPFSQFGFSPDILPERGEYPPMVNVSVEFSDGGSMPVYIIDRRFFFARDRLCHAELLKDLVLELEWYFVVENSPNYFLETDCS